MAPSRRKGASKAAQAAAARRQWKLGDLVLAKVKGFPAWPATVSEPEKWGYSADWKKVLVFFFGTQQIAFCNPADVEAFTEEKKQSLLGKRHGKGADFVRAVQEIIESFEKLKKENQVDELNSNSNGGNTVDSSFNVSEDQIEAPEVILNLHPKSSSSSIDKHEPGISVEDGSATAEVDASLDKEDLIEESAATAMVSETPLVTTCSSRKRPGDLRLQSCILKREEVPARRSRSSSRMESLRLRNFIVPCDDDAKNAADVSGNAVQDRFPRRNKRTWKSRDASLCDDVNLATYMSNGCVEDDNSEVVPVDSDTFSLNNGSVIDSGCKGDLLETALKCLEGDAELIRGLDLQIKAVSKKKRKPNRKRATNDVAEPITILDIELGQDNGLHGSSHSTQTDCGKLTGNSSKEDGDEHLPLVKRARVRMNKPSSAKEEVDSFSHIEESMKEPMLSLIIGSPICDDTGGRESSIVNGALDIVTASRVCTQILGNRPQFWNPKKDQSFGCSADGEAVLPPSKRLHRALEAMSANVAEDDERCNHDSLAMRTSSVDCSNSCMNLSLTVESNSGNGLGLHTDDSFKNKAPGLSTSSHPVVLEENTKSDMDVGAYDQRKTSSNTWNNECSNNDFPDFGHHVDSKNLSGGSSDCCTIGVAHHIEIPGNLSPSRDRGEADTESDKWKMDELPLEDCAKIESSNSQAENTNTDCDMLVHPLKSLDPVSGTSHEFIEGLPQNDASSLHCGSSGSQETIKSREPQLQDNRDIKAMSNDAKDVKMEKDPSSVPYPAESLSEQHVSGIWSSPSPTDGGDSLGSRISTLDSSNISGCRISTLDSSNILPNNGSISPDVDLQHKRTSSPVEGDEKSEAVVCQRPKSVSRYAEALAALSSFETMLGTLTRTKDSISRATRVAIDCGKLGVASKVLEIVARHLETESSLPRKIDFFFLVDSIAQHCRGLKGDAGGMYGSAIQVVLPRLLSAAAPPGSSANGNRRQCLKVLKLWLERKIVPQFIIRRHMRELDCVGVSSSAGPYCRRSSRTERSLDDPLREMEGMLVDEYGSNSSFQLPGLCMPRMLKEEDVGSDSDGESFEAVTPEHNPQTNEEHKAPPATERHRHILEDVDGELEMEDVAPCDVDMSSICGVTGVHVVPASHNQYEQHFPILFAPPLPHDVPPLSPPLPLSPPPPPPPAPLSAPQVLHPPCATPDLTPYTDSHNLLDSRVPPPPQQLNGPRKNQAIPDAVHYRHESRDFHRHMPESTSCSYSNYHTSSGRDIPQSDGPTFHNKDYPLRPPHAPPSNHFYYVKGEQPMKPRREGPPPYHNRYDFVQNGDREHYYNNHDRMKPSPYEPCDSWRFPPHSSAGPRYPEKGKGSYGNAPYAGPPRDPSRFPGQGWRFPPRSMNHRHSFVPPYDGPIPVTSRGPGYWRPR